MQLRAPMTIAALALLLGACGDAQGGTPSISTSGTTSRHSDASPGQPTHPGTLNVPKVTNPIRTASFEQKPCSVLTAAQLQELSISTSPEPKTIEAGPACEWGDVFDDGITIDGAFVTKLPSSVAGLYRNNELGRYAYFKPVSILGYPAAFNGLTDARNQGSCGIGIGVRDELIYSISFQLRQSHPKYSDPCSALKGVSKMALKTMTKRGS